MAGCVATTEVNGVRTIDIAKGEVHEILETKSSAELKRIVTDNGIFQQRNRGEL